jgi:hypothetical protein
VLPIGTAAGSAAMLAAQLDMAWTPFWFGATVTAILLLLDD